MSWLGVNLNDSLSSIKGQITSFTKDVLADDDGVADHIEVVVPKKRIKEYETSIALYQEEIKELKANRAEAEDRLRAQDYNYSVKITSLTKQLHETQEQFQNLKAKSSEWKWEEGSEDSKKQFNQFNSTEESAVYVEKVSLLQRQLTEERRRREDEILAIQEAHRIEVLKLNAAKDAGFISSTTFTNVSLNEDILENEKDRRIKELEEELYSLRSDHASLCEEREQLNANLVDLDNQHQMIIDEILRSKKVLADEIKQLKDELGEQKCANSQSHESDSKQLNVLKEKIQDLNLERSSLLGQVDELKQINESLLVRMDELQNIVVTQNEEIASLGHAVEEGLRESSAEVSRSEALVKSLKDADGRALCLQEDLNKAKLMEEYNEMAINEMKDRLSYMQTMDDKASQVINDLNDKILYKEEEILKLEAVLEERNNEHMNTFRKLKQHEALTLVTIKEFQNENQGLKKEIGDLKEKVELEQSKTKEDPEATQMKMKLDKILKDMIEKCSAQSAEELPAVVSEINSEVAFLRCERDRLSDELKDTQELADSLVNEKSDLERECEDLRDQLEELQCGERVVPEGSLTPRPLPTIEEEEADISNTAPSDAESNELDIRTVEGSGNVDLHERIHQLNSQVAALSEARQNLELELSIVKKERVDLDQRLSEANSQLGNLLNLEAEAVNLRNENESLQYRLNDSHKHLEGFNHIQEEKIQLQKQIQSMTNAVDRMNLESSHSQASDDMERMRDALETKINHQSMVIDENIKEIARLKSILKETNNTSTHFAQYQDKISSLEAELDKNKGLVIYKDDQIDQLKHGIEQIGAIFQIPSSDLRQTYISIKQEHDALRRRVNDMSSQLEFLKEENEELKEENAARCGSENETIQKLTVDLQTVNAEVAATKKDLEIQKLSNETLINENTDAINQWKLQYEVLLKKKNDFVNKVDLYINENATLQDQITGTTDKCLYLETVLEFKETTLANLQTEISNKETSYNIKMKSLEAQLLSKQEHSSEEVSSLESNFKQTIEAMENEKEVLSNQISELRIERQQMIETSTKKHQESVTYYTEIQRLNDVLRKEEHRTSSEISSLNQKVQELYSERQNISKELSVTKQNLNTTVSESVPKSEAKRLQDENTGLSEELQNLNETLKKQQDVHRALVKERDHLRMANSSFNSQYEEKSREANGLQEKEKHLSQEIQRLKQHLVEVEETYTNEAVKSEQREASLRQSLAKMHEKIASHSNRYSNENQKTVAQLESIQDRLNEAVHERDESKAQLQISEESSLQHQEALARLQQVLQDFQKNQVREISMATEREKRKLEEEKTKSTELEIQLKMINAKLLEIESSSATTAALREELQAKEDMVVALKSQVNAVNLAAKKSQEQVALLQSCADGKVDKHLLRNLFVGYFATPSDKQREVLRIVAEVLDFSPEERSRTGIDQQPGSWLTSIANFLAPPPSNIRVASKVDVLDHSSLSQAFIRFLEEESSPRTHLKLPAVQMAEEANQKAQKKALAKNIVIGNSSTDPVHSLIPNPVYIPSTLPQTLPEAMNSLLSNASSLQGSFPLISTPAFSTAPTLNSGTEDVSTPKFLNNLLNSNEGKDPESETNLQAGSLS